MTAVVSISGGKDSHATAILALDKYGPEGVRLVMADTGHEHPITMDFVRDYLPGALGVPVEIVRADFSRQIAGKRDFIARNWEYMGVPLAQVDRALATPPAFPTSTSACGRDAFPPAKLNSAPKNSRGTPSTSSCLTCTAPKAGKASAATYVRSVMAKENDP